MSQQVLRNALLKSSISIDSLRKSVSNFTKGMKGAQKTATQIVRQTDEDNKFKRSLISKDRSFFRKRREAVRRRQREDEIEASTVGGVIKRQGTVLGKSTKGFLGRILDFFGIVLIGWMVTRLPQIIKSIQGLMSNMQFVANIMGGFINVLTKVVVGIGGFLFKSINTLRGYNWREPQEDIARNTAKMQEGFIKFESDLVDSLNQFNDPKQAYNDNAWQKFPDEVDGKEEDNQQGEGEGQTPESGEGELTPPEEGKNQWWDFLDLFPNKKKDDKEEGDTDESGDEKGTFSEVKAKPTMGTPTRDEEGNIDGFEKILTGGIGIQDPDVGFGDGEEDTKNQEDEVQNLNKGGEVKGKEGIDQNLAKLTKGEFVIQKQIAEKNKEFLKMFNSGKFSPMQAMNQVKGSFNEEEMMAGLNSAMGQITDKMSDFSTDESKKKDDKGNRGFLGWRSSVDWMTGGLTDLDKKGNEFNLINPDNKKEKIEKLKTARKPKTIMIIKTVTKSMNSGSTTIQVPKSVKTMGVSQSSVNSTIKSLQELESAFT